VCYIAFDLHFMLPEIALFCGVVVGWFFSPLGMIVLGYSVPMKEQESGFTSVIQ
jgi:hypothetical protein